MTARRAPHFAIIICDMWDAHHCVSAARRVHEMAPRMNDVITRLRTSGALIIHSPGDCSDFYSDTAARQRAMDAPHSTARVPFAWNIRDVHREPALPASLAEPGSCSCDSAEPCEQRPMPPYPWARQIPSIEIRAEDAVTDDGQEVFNLLEQHGIEDVVLMGVHTNICVLARSYGIRQLVYAGKRPILCRDLTDSFHRDPRGHAWGNQHVIEHVEKHWCPTVSSDELHGRFHL